MKKLFLTLFTACIAISAMAIDLPKQGFGLQIGWAQPILRLNDPNNPATAKDSLSNITRLMGVKAGLLYDASYIAGFGSTMGINYTFGVDQGTWQQNGIGLLNRKRTRTMYHEVEIFVDWQYKFEVAKETYLMLYTGPTIQCGIACTSRQEIQSADIYGDIHTEYGEPVNRYKSDNPDDLLTRFNVTWGVGAGFQYQRYFIRGGYDFGLVNPYKNVDFQNGNHTRGRFDQWSIKVGMYLWYHE